MRSINTKAATKAVALATKQAAFKAAAIAAGTSLETPAATTKPAKASKQAKAAKRATVAPAALAVTSSYAGPSVPFNSSRSRSTLRLDIASGSYTYRDDTGLRDLLAAYGAKPFNRANLDAGLARRLVSARVLTTSDNGQTFTVTSSGQAFAKANKPLIAGDKLPLPLTVKLAGVDKH